MMRDLHRKLWTGDHVQGLELGTLLFICEAGLRDQSYQTLRGIKTWR
jgi:hypothetical protein